MFEVGKWFESFAKHSQILLVGECDFSFTLSLLDYANDPTKITSTCFETDPEKESRKKNIEILRQKGVQILLGVDATKLTENPDLKNDYDYIIFNFPHIGGKSRIQLNRELLRSFFTSASKCLSSAHDKSRVIISLCQGQGGVSIDQPRRPRAYGDTWKVVEMAAHGSFILEKIEPFQAIDFRHYKPSGYGKKGDGSFHTEGSLTYIFRKSCPPRSGLPLGNNHFLPELIYKRLMPGSIQTQFGSVICSGIHASSFHDSYIKSKPIQHIIDLMIEEIVPQHILNADEVAPLHLPFSNFQAISDPIEKFKIISYQNMRKTMAKGYVGDASVYLRDSLVYSIPHLPFSNCLALVTGHVFHDLGPNFSIPPIGTEAMVCGEGATIAVLKTISLFLGKHNKFFLRIPRKDKPDAPSFFNHHFETLTYEIITMQQMLVIGYVFCKIFDTLEVCTVDLDTVAMILYSANDWRELRTKGCQVFCDKNMSDYLLTFSNEQTEIKLTEQCGKLKNELQTVVKFIPESLYPQTFILDVSFSLIDGFNERDFWTLLWHVAGDIITKVELLEIYDPPPDKAALGHKRSWCYRLYYCSYEFPLHKQGAVKIQNEAVNWALVNVLQVKVN